MCHAAIISESIITALPQLFSVVERSGHWLEPVAEFQWKSAEAADCGCEADRAAVDPRGLM